MNRQSATGHRQSLLFLCSGNYYRSRFAEHLFNHLSQQRALPWHATSRALAATTGPWKTAAMSPHTTAALAARNIPCPGPHREPLACLESDLASAHRVVALKELEHRPMVESKFPHLAGKVEYWHVHDVDFAHPDQALAELEQLIHTLVAQLAQSAVRNP